MTRNTLLIWKVLQAKTLKQSEILISYSYFCVSPGAILFLNLDGKEDNRVLDSLVNEYRHIRVKGFASLG